MKLHALPPAPPPPPLPPIRTSTTATPAVLPFQPQPAVNAVQPAATRRSSAEARGNGTTQAKPATSQVATPIGNAVDADALQLPYRRGALLDISA